MLPSIMTKVMPSAMRPMVDVCTRMFTKLPGSKKWFADRLKKIRMAITKIQIGGMIVSAFGMWNPLLISVPPDPRYSEVNSRPRFEATSSHTARMITTQVTSHWA